MKNFKQYFEQHNPFGEEVEWLGLGEDQIGRLDYVGRKRYELDMLDCPSAHLIYPYGIDRPKISVPVYDFLDLPGAGFAGNYFDSIDELRNMVDNLRNAGATEIEVGIAIVRPGDKYGDTLFFRGLNREQIFEILPYEPDDINLRDGVWRIWWD